MDIKIPIKKTSMYTEQLSLKVEKELDESLSILKGQKIDDEGKEIDVPELIREGIRAAVNQAFRKYGLKRAS